MELQTPTNRGEKTREALLTAAMDAFGRAGFDAASNRAIADSAGVNQALIGYHFGGKRGLYLAMFEHISEQMQLELM
ncbi:MAG: AcrR family transcriptional regulator, partial [Halioglobus sp.]